MLGKASVDVSVVGIAYILSVHDDAAAPGAAGQLASGRMAQAVLVFRDGSGGLGRALAKVVGDLLPIERRDRSAGAPTGRRASNLNAALTAWRLVSISLRLNVSMNHITPVSNMQYGP
jgi:hypothetical protein